MMGIFCCRKKTLIYLTAALSVISIHPRVSASADATGAAEEKQATVRKSVADILKEKMIDSNFEKTDIRDILDHISKAAGVNIVFCEGEAEEKADYLVTTYFRKVSAFETLDTITRISGLSYYIDRNIVWVGKFDELKELMKTKTLENILKQKQIDLNFSNADIRDVLSYIAEATETNIYLYERNSEGKSTYPVSMLLKDISAFGALDVITRTKGLSYYIDDYVVWVGKEDELEDLMVSVSRIYRGRHGNVEQLKKMIEGLLSEKGKVLVDRQKNILFVSDRQDVMETIDKVLEAIN